MKLNSKEFEKLLNEESEEFEEMFDKEKIEEKMTKLHAKEKHADLAIYGNKDPKRKFKR